jgi:hypothetical protein
MQLNAVNWGVYPFAVRIVESLQLDNVGMAHNPHDLQFTILLSVSGRWPVEHDGELQQWAHTLKRLSWRTRLMAASSPLGIIFV